MVTMREVASRSGVSHTTVSHVLRDKRDGIMVSEATRRRVLETAREMGYRPNASARSFRTGKFGGVGLLMSSNVSRSGLPAGLLQGVGDALAAREMHLTLSRLSDEKLGDATPKMLREWMCDGLLIDYTHRIPARLVELIGQHRLPAVWLNSKRAGDCVYPDDWDAAVQLAQLVVAAGHRRVAYLDFAHRPDDPDEHYSARDRRDGVTRTLAAAGIVAEQINGSALDPAQWVPMLREVLARPDRPTALICYSDEVQFALLAAAHLGLDVPRELSIVSFGSPRRGCGGLELSQMAVPEAQLGGVAVEMLLEKIEKPDAVLPARALALSWEAGATLAAAQ